MTSLEFRDRAVFLPEHATLVLADLHLGKDAASNVEWPVGERGDIAERFATLVERYDPDEIVVAGDFLHSFSTLPRGVMESIRELTSTAREVGARVVVTPGNHDSLLGEVWKGPTSDEYRVGGWLITHGHEEPEGKANGYIVGHDHPTIDIEGRRQPCYLYAEDHYRGADLLMLPSFTKLAAGVVVNGMRTRDFQSPLVTRADDLEPVVRDEADDETLRFPSLGEFRDLL